jgi:hypothetical protein
LEKEEKVVVVFGAGLYVAHPPTRPWLRADLFFILSPLILLFAAGQIVKQAVFFFRSMPARGRIIGLDPKRRRYKTYYYPMVEFMNEKHEREVFVGGVGSTWKREALIGRGIAVRYCPGGEGLDVLDGGVSDSSMNRPHR